jgi:hypothetical protein
MQCCICRREIDKDAGEPHAAVWEERDGKQWIAFAHIKCTESPEYEDITAEVMGGKPTK